MSSPNLFPGLVAVVAVAEFSELQEVKDSESSDALVLVTAVESLSDPPDFFILLSFFTRRVLGMA